MRRTFGRRRARHIIGPAGAGLIAIARRISGCNNKAQGVWPQPEVGGAGTTPGNRLVARAGSVLEVCRGSAEGAEES